LLAQVGFLTQGQHESSTGSGIGSGTGGDNTSIRENLLSDESDLITRSSGDTGKSIVYLDFNAQ
jgi:hypothetical protein